MAEPDNLRRERTPGAIPPSGLPAFDEIVHSHWPQLGLPDLVALGSRIVVGTLLVVLYVFGDLRSSAPPAYLFVGLGALILTAVFGSLSLLVWRMRPRRVLRALFVPDLIASGLLIYATGLYQDPLYPWMVGLAMIYGAGLALRESIGFATLVGLAYAAGHLFAHLTLHTADDVAIIAFKAVSIVLTAALVGDVSRKQAQREMRLRQSQRHYHELN